MVRSITLAALLISGSSLYAADDCRATFDGSLTRKDPGETGMTYSAIVKVAVEAPCAVVRFDVVIVEDVTGGQQTEVRLHREVKIRDSTPANLKMSYKLKKGHSIVSHRFEQTSCEICESS